MNVTEFDADLISYMALAECASAESDAKILEDISSKMAVHANKMKSKNINFKLRL